MERWQKGGGNARADGFAAFESLQRSCQFLFLQVKFNINFTNKDENAKFLYFFLIKKKTLEKIVLYWSGILRLFEGQGQKK